MSFETSLIFSFVTYLPLNVTRTYLETVCEFHNVTYKYYDNESIKLKADKEDSIHKVRRELNLNPFQL